MFGRTIAIAGAALACAAAPASAGTILVTGTLVVTDPGNAVVVDPLSAAGACTTSPGEARCAIASELYEIRVSLGDGADAFTAALDADDHTSLSVDGGSGRDTLNGDSDARVAHYATELNGGPGNDVPGGGVDSATGGDGDDAIRNCDDGNDTLIGDPFEFRSECEILDLG